MGTRSLLEGYHWKHNDLVPSFLDGEDRNHTLTGFWKNDDYPRLVKWMLLHRDKLEKLSLAAERPNCYFPVNLNIMDDKKMNRESAMRGWSNFLVRQANNDIANGKFDSALDKYCAALQIANHSLQQLQSGGIYSGIGIRFKVLRRFFDFIINEDLIAEQLSRIEKTVLNINFDWQTKWSGLLEYESLVYKQLFLNKYEINSKGKTRFHRNPYLHIKKQLSEFSGKNDFDISQSYAERKILKAAAIIKWFCLYTNPKKVSKAIDQVQKEFLEKTSETSTERQRAQRRSFIKLNHKHLIQWSYSSLLDSYHLNSLSKRLIATKRACLILTAIRKYRNNFGEWPKTLNDIRSLASETAFVDPINNGAFIYKLTEDGFTLYSMGKNATDDNEDSDDMTFWPLRRKTKPPAHFDPWP